MLSGRQERCVLLGVSLTASDTKMEEVKSRCQKKKGDGNGDEFTWRPDPLETRGRAPRRNIIL